LRVPLTGSQLGQQLSAATFGIGTQIGKAFTGFRQNFEKKVKELPRHIKKDLLATGKYNRVYIDLQPKKKK
jgi:hypothetical protein